MHVHEPRPFRHRFRDTFRVPHLWLMAAVMVGGRLYVLTRFGGSVGLAAFNILLIGLPGFIGGVALVSAFTDPYVEWRERRR